MKNILDTIKERPLVFDGAMGTMLYQKGVFVNVSFDELSLSRPDLIRDIHRQYVLAGADVIETNSYAANRILLAPFGLANKTEQIIRASVQRAREACEERTFIAGSVGPCLQNGESFIATRKKEVEEAFTEQINIFADEKVDLILFETFSNVDELRLAAKIAHKAGLVTVTSFTLDISNPDISKIKMANNAVDILDKDSNVDIVGMNCGGGPFEMFELVKNSVKHTSKPFLVMPNAGGANKIGGRTIYMHTPEYFTEYAKRFIEIGVKCVGGCCGTTPDTIRVMARAVKSLSGVKEHVKITVAQDTEKTANLTPLEKKSALGKKLITGEKIKLVEILPPRTGKGLKAFYEKGTLCKDAGIDAVNIPDGPRASPRISVLAAAQGMQEHSGINAVPHYCCRDRNLIAMQSDLLAGYAVGLVNWLFITGDPPKLGDYPDTTGVFDIDAIGLANLASNLNRGIDAAGKPLGDSTKMVIGVGVNPVAVDMERELDRFKAKIDAGAEYAITQPIFKTEELLAFIEKIRKMNINIPIIAGIYPFISLKNATFMKNYVPGIVIPDYILDRLSKCSTVEDGLKTGVEIAQEICTKISDSFAGIQVSAPVGRVDAAIQTLQF